MQKLQVCGRCYKSFPISGDHFYWNGRKRCWHSWCKSCCIETAVARKPRKPRVPRERPTSNDPVEAYFIKVHERISNRHRVKNWAGDVVSTRYLINLYEKSSGTCYYTGLQYSLFEKGPLHCTVDRIDSSLGYVEGNVVLCCWFVNCAKNQWSIEEMKPLWAYLPK